MRWNKKYNYPSSSRATEDGIRRYVLGEAKLPSVTSILDATKSEEDKAALANWRERTGHKEAEAITKAASSRGSQMHSYLEAKEIIDKGLTNRLEEIYGVECTMHYPERYAGTADCVGVYEGKETIIDFKQSNKPKKTEYIDSWFLQTAAYSLAHNVVYNSNINACVILVCTVDNLFQEFKIQTNLE